MSAIQQLVISTLEEFKAQDTVSIHTSSQTEMMEWMIICTGTSNRHVRSLADNLITRAKKAGIRIIGHEGMEYAEWVLIDLGDVVVHLMQQETRDYYQIERLWEPFAKKAFTPH